MFSKIKGLFEKNGSIEVDASGEPTSEDLQLATAVLLLEMAGRDEDYAQAEVKCIADTLQRQFGTSNEGIVHLLESADSLRQKHEEIDGFIKLINQHFSNVQKRTILAMLWRVVVADGQVDQFEQRFTTQLKYRLQLSDEDVAAAQQMARRGEV